MKFSLLLISLSISSGYGNVDRDAHFKGGSNYLYHETIDLRAFINGRNGRELKLPVIPLPDLGLNRIQKHYNLLR